MRAGARLRQIAPIRLTKSCRGSTSWPRCSNDGWSEHTRAAFSIRSRRPNNNMLGREPVQEKHPEAQDEDQ